MFNRFCRYAFLGSVLIAALAVAQPALAYTELGTTGTVGAHSLTDTSGSPGAVCVYKFNSDNAWQLKHIYVASGARSPAIPDRGRSPTRAPTSSDTPIQGTTRVSAKKA